MHSKQIAMAGSDSNSQEQIQRRVGMAFSKRCVDAFVIGGGPAGLAAAIALRSAGMSVAVADASRPPIDKACGEGLMPAGVAALAALGVTVPVAKSYPLRGVRFRAKDAAVSAHFAGQNGVGMRRTVLHEALMARAREQGVQMLWGTYAEALPQGKVSANGEEWTAGWTIGADGQRSRVRQFAGLNAAREVSRRYGFRRHFAVAPWTDSVEVYWGPEGQAYVTPTGGHEVCVALVVEEKRNRVANLPSIFPELVERLKDSKATSSERGAATICRSLPRVTRGRVALIGEAAASIDAITGEGLTLAFQQALALGDSLARGNPDLYEEKTRQIFRRPLTMSRLMVFLGRHPRLLERILRASGSDASLFAHFAGVHLGGRPLLGVAPGTVVAFGWNFVSA